MKKQNKYLHIISPGTTWAALARTPANDMEYSVYVYHRNGVAGENDNDWERKHSGSDYGSALQHARDLGDSGAYRRVELKKKYFDHRAQHNLEKTMLRIEGSALSFFSSFQHYFIVSIAAGLTIAGIWLLIFAAPG